MSAPRTNEDIQKTRDLVQRRLRKRPCLWQIKVGLALRDKKDVVGIAATGAGKTLSFYIALLLALEDGIDGMVIVVTPLNILSKQNADSQMLKDAGIAAASVNVETCKTSPEIFSVSKVATSIWHFILIAYLALFQNIEKGKYQVVIINPKLLHPSGVYNSHFGKMWTNPAVARRLQYFVFDEGHCISEWGSFRPEYPELGLLHHLLPSTIPFYVASATLPSLVLEDVRKSLQLRGDKTCRIMRSNDRPNLYLMVRTLEHAANSYKDLDFLLAEKPGEHRPAPFVVFFNSIREAEDAANHLRSQLPIDLQNKVVWFHSHMSSKHREETLEAFRRGEIWGLCVTDAFGMVGSLAVILKTGINTAYLQGVDLRGIEIIVQWKASCNMATLWQRFGRGARGPGEEAFVILLVEKKYTDVDRQAKEAAALKKRKATDQVPVSRPAKRNMSSRPVEDAGSSLRAELNSPSVSDSQSALFARYHKRSKPPASARQQGPEHELCPAIDDFINAQSRGLSCRRDSIKAFFEDKTQSKLHCTFVRAVLMHSLSL
jgi:superfamily II DNA helicase RecQ